MRTDKSVEDLLIINFDKAKEIYDLGRRYMSWWGFTESGEIVDYTEPDFKYPAPDCRYEEFRTNRDCRWNWS